MLKTTLKNKRKTLNNKLIYYLWLCNISPNRFIYMFFCKSFRKYYIKQENICFKIWMIYLNALTLQQET